MKGLVRIRLVRMGRVRQPVYNIAVGGKRGALKSVPIEVIGTYNPTPQKQLAKPEEMAVKHVELDFHRAKYWLGVGAQPSDSVKKLFERAGLL